MTRHIMSVESWKKNNTTLNETEPQNLIRKTELNPGSELREAIFDSQQREFNFCIRSAPHPRQSLRTEQVEQASTFNRSLSENPFSSLS